MDEKQTEEKKIQLAPSSIKVSFGRAFNDPGKRFKEEFRWNKDHNGIVKVGETDIQAKIDAESKGMTASEQISRILRGDTSSIPADDPLPPGDYCLAEEMTKEQILAANLAPLNKATEQAQAANMTLEEMEDHLKAMMEQLKAEKAKIEQAKAEPQNETPKEAKENA